MESETQYFRGSLTVGSAGPLLKMVIDDVKREISTFIWKTDEWVESDHIFRTYLSGGDYDVVDAKDLTPEQLA